MSLTNTQLRSFAYHMKVYGSTQAMDAELRATVVGMGLIDSRGLTPAGRDALATVPYLVDPEPPKPAEPETRACEACEGQGARYVAKVCHVTLHERTVLVKCEAPGCEMGRVVITPEQWGRRVFTRPKLGVRQNVVSDIDVQVNIVGHVFKLNEPITDDRRLALLDFAVESGATVASCAARGRWVVGVPKGDDTGGTRIRTDRQYACVRHRSAIDVMIMLVEPGTTLEKARAVAWDAGWCPKLGWADPDEQPAASSLHSDETLALARLSVMLHVSDLGVVLSFGKYAGRCLIEVPCTYVRWACEVHLSCSACATVFENERARRAAAGITVNS